MGEGKIGLPPRKVILNNTDLTAKSASEMVVSVDFEFDLREGETPPTYHELDEAVREVVAKLMDPEVGKPREHARQGLHLEPHGDHPRAIWFDKTVGGKDVFLYRCGEYGCKLGTHWETDRETARRQWNLRVGTEKAEERSKKEREIQQARETLTRLAPDPPLPVMCAHGKVIPCGQTECLCPKVEEPEKAKSCCPPFAPVMFRKTPEGLKQEYIYFRCGRIKCGREDGGSLTEARAISHWNIVLEDAKKNKEGAAKYTTPEICLCYQEPDRETYSVGAYWEVWYRCLKCGVKAKKSRCDWRAIKSWNELVDRRRAAQTPRVCRCCCTCPTETT